MIAKLTKAVLGVVAKVRETLANCKPKLSRGHPSKRARKATRQSKRIGQKVAELFKHRHLFVKHHLSPAEHKTLQRITCSLPQLRTLCHIMDEVYRLFDRRCRTNTTLAKLARLRHRVARFQQMGKTLQKLFSPNLEQALTFLDDNVCLPTSNEVERGKRRYLNRQKTVYSVRTKPSIRTRIALDMLRDASAKRYTDTTLVLHEARAG